METLVEGEDKDGTFFLMVGTHPEWPGLVLLTEMKSGECYDLRLHVAKQLGTALIHHAEAEAERLSAETELHKEILREYVDGDNTLPVAA